MVQVLSPRRARTARDQFGRLVTAAYCVAGARVVKRALPSAVMDHPRHGLPRYGADSFVDVDVGSIEIEERS
jgi:hypothetical protein